MARLRTTAGKIGEPTTRVDATAVGRTPTSSTKPPPTTTTKGTHAGVAKGSRSVDRLGDLRTVISRYRPRASGAATRDLGAGVGGLGGAGRGAVRERDMDRSTLFAGDAERAAERAAEVAALDAEGREEEEEGRVPLSMATRWKKRVTFVARTVQIWAFLFHVLLKLLRQKLVQRDEARMSARRRKLGKYLCQAFLKLGPTFIKIGQVRCAIQRVISFVLLKNESKNDARHSLYCTAWLYRVYTNMCR